MKVCDLVMAVGDEQSVHIASAVEGISYPAVPDARASALLAVLYQLDASQWWSSEQLRDAQMRQLSTLLDHAAREVPFYQREPYQNASGSSFDDKAWRALPILTRAEVQGAADSLLARSIPSSHGDTDEIFTSGSTGKPVKVIRTQVSSKAVCRSDAEKPDAHLPHARRENVLGRRHPGGPSTLARGLFSCLETSLVSSTTLHDVPPRSPPQGRVGKTMISRTGRYQRLQRLALY